MKSLSTANLRRRSQRPPLVGHFQPRWRRALVAAVAFIGALTFGAHIASGQAQPYAGGFAPPPPPAALPEPIYWKQQLFLVPYQWGSAAQASTAQAVYLFVSRDRGASWQKISDAKPHVKAFNYRADGDGEYWFAVRTLDNSGRIWPEGPYQPELRVIVDTVLPRIEAMRARATQTGAIEIEWRVSDQNLNPASWTVEAQLTANGAWQPVVLQGAGSGEQGTSTLPAPSPLLRAAWQPPAGSRPAVLRASISDAAGNSATYQTTVDYSTQTAGPLLSQPSTNVATPHVSNLPVPSQDGLFAVPPQIPSAAQATSVPAIAAPPAQPTNSLPAQQWSPDATIRAPFRLWTTAPSSADDGVTSYGNPHLFDAPRSAVSNTAAADEASRVNAAYADVAITAPSVFANTNVFDNRTVTPLQPFRQASLARLPSPNAAEVAPVRVTQDDIRPLGSPGVPVTPPAATYVASPVAPKLVGSRTFALEYDLDSVGHWGVSRVELWGTRDGGQTWRSFAQDDDNRSPLVVTVDDEGTYGFRIVADSAGSAESNRPQPGDAPELWVSVDLRRPVIELTSIERGHGNQADHLILKWRAQDNNLEPRPIALFYSSRPTGPWSAVATNLEDTGEYAWRVERHVPARIFLRIEARDTAGNLAAYQTRQPVEIPQDAVAGQLRGAAPVGSTAVGADAGYR
jgi:hypothetical protein